VKKYTEALITREQAKLKKKEIDSSESSMDSMASRINFWRDINTKDGEYKNAIIVSTKK
jgi:hypothetical protein